MKKLVAILVIFLFAIGTVSAFAADAAKPAATTAKSDSTVKTLFSDAKTLVTKQIPETPNQKSKTHRIFDQTGKKVVEKKTDAPVNAVK